MLDTLLRYGQDCQLETGGATVRELPFIRVVINNPESFEIPEWLAGIERLGYTPESLEKYYETKILPNTHMREIYPGVTKFYRPDGIKYLYAELLFAYPRDPEFDQAVYEMTESLGIEHTLQFLQSVERSSARADRNEIAESILVDPEVSDRQKAEVLMELFVPPVNQVQRILDQIRNMPDDADKTFFLWQPSVHGMRDRGRPCLVQGSLLVRDGRIDMKATFRSHDIPKGWIENIYGIRRFLMDIANTTGYEVGTLTVESESAHMYLADVEWANELVTREIRNKQPVKVYDAETMSDPRGNWQINVVDGQIRCVLQDQVGIPLLELEGRTAKDIIAQFRHFRLLSDPNHAMDLGAQLANAELANLVGPEFLPYIQDRSLNFRNIRNALKE
jgi:hypothetical protein